MLIPDFLAHLQVDTRRKLPVPYSNQHDTGPDFTAINSRNTAKCAQERLCGICERDLGYWLAFIGGPRSYASRLYANPAMHPACAEFSLGACPYIAVGRARRATDAHLMPGATRAPEMALDKPDTWVMGITRQYTAEPRSTLNGGATVLFHAAPFKSAKAYAYDDTGRLAPCTLPTT